MHTGYFLWGSQNLHTTDICGEGRFVEIYFQ